MSELLRAFESGHAEKPVEARDWPPLPDRARALPAFPVDALPDRFSAFVKALAAAKEVAPDMAVAFALGVISGAAVGRVEVEPKHREPDYREPAQLFILCRGASGERKTPTLRYVSAPLESILEERRTRIKAENDAVDRELKALERSCRGRRPEDPLAMEEKRAAAEARRLPEPESLQADVTVESVVQGMAEHEGRAVILADEADFLNVLAGRSYSRDGGAVNLGAILSGYTNSPFHGRRVTRGEWHIPRASLSICLGCQPGLLSEFMKNAAGADRGLLARFLYFLPRSMLGHRRAELNPVPEQLTVWWRDAVARIAAVNRMVLPFDTGAETAYLDFFAAVEARLLKDLGGPLQAWAGKLCGNTVRLAGLLALLAGEDHVTRQAWDAAAYIADLYLVPHAQAAFGGADPRLTDHARALLPRLRDMDRFKQSELWRDAGRYILGEEGLEAFKAALEVLERWGYIRKVAEQQQASGGRPPSPVFEVHPDLRAGSGAPAVEVEL